MKFEEVYGRTRTGMLSQEEAAEILGISERDVSALVGPRMQVWTVVSGKTAVIASGKPFRPSMTAIRMSPTPRVLSSFIGINRIERPVLPLPDLLEKGIGDPADQIGRDLDTVELLQVPLNLARRHAAGVKTDCQSASKSSTPNNKSTSRPIFGMHSSPQAVRPACKPSPPAPPGGLNSISQVQALRCWRSNWS